jgi:hypothetical protein
MKKYKTWEMVKMLTENPKLVFENDKGYYKVRVDESHAIVLGGGSHMIVSTNEEFVLIQQSVSFMEAVKAYSEGKTIRCERDGGISYYKATSASDLNILHATNGHTLSCRDVTHGKWYVEE